MHPVFAKLGLGWIAAQSVLSYFMAGLAKARHSRWWSGAAVQALFSSDGPYVLLHGVRALAASPGICAALGCGLVLFELTFPVVLLLPFAAKVALLALALLFHLANAAILGLNRFIWAWAATYPALLYF